VVITFDDGNLDVYENAFPVMKELGFVGAIYIVANRLKAKDFISAEQLSEMAKTGWEIGSHGMSHIDLTQNHDLASYEILQSRLDIEEAVSVTVTSIAYPYGTVDSFVAQKVSDYGYYDAMGLGVSWRHTWGTLYYLNRREVHGDGSLTEFTALLPWSGPLGEFTPTPTATIIP
jgi:peptidoglycan/xylan/chitin deacetylase (PgdA/CDA1 family)